MPNFGVDHEILASQADLTDAEKKLKTKLQVVKKAADPPRDYFVPNLGKDRDVIITQIDIDQAQQQHNHVLQASFEKPKGHPVDYFVPNFGTDKEIIATQQHISEAEKTLGTKLTANKKAPGHPVDYKVPNFGMDQDIKETRASLVSTEKKLGNWNPVKDADGAYVVPQSVALQTEAVIRDDPICSSAGCTQFKHPEEKTHPMDYPVPSFGADPEMTTTSNSIAIGEAQYNHKIIMGTEESKKQWENPAKKAPYNFNPALDHDIKVS